MSSEIISAEAGHTVVSNVALPDAGALIHVDCRPEHDIIGNFDPRCQYIGATQPELACTDLGSPIGAPSVGSFRLTVAHPERVTIGSPVVLDGADPDVTLAAAFGNTQILVQTSGAPASGTLVFDAFDVGKILAGRLVDVRLTFQPDPPFVCTIKNSAFIGDWGPGVRDR